MNGSTTFNWSQNPDIQELTRFFQGVAMTIDYGRILAFQYRFDKLGMDERMKELEDLQASHNVEELAIIAPTLRKIAADPNLMNISRESARRLLKSFDPPAVSVQIRHLNLEGQSVKEKPVPVPTSCSTAEFGPATKI